MNLKKKNEIKKNKHEILKIWILKNNIDIKAEHGC